MGFQDWVKEGIGLGGKYLFDEANRRYDGIGSKVLKNSVKYGNHYGGLIGGVLNWAGNKYLSDAKRSNLSNVANKVLDYIPDGDVKNTLTKINNATQGIQEPLTEEQIQQQVQQYHQRLQHQFQQQQRRLQHQQQQLQQQQTQQRLQQQQRPLQQRLQQQFQQQIQQEPTLTGRLQQRTSAMKEKKNLNKLTSIYKHKQRLVNNRRAKNYIRTSERSKRKSS